MTDLRLFPRSDDFYLDFLFRFKNSKDFVYYSDLSSEDKNCADVFYQIHLLNIDHNFIIFLHDNIKIWETCYNRSFNWYEYYLLDLKNDEYGRLKGVSHE